MSKYTPIKIKPENEGKLHSALHVADDKKIPVKKLESAKNSPDPARRKQATFALNARKWNHPSKYAPKD